MPACLIAAFVATNFESFLGATTQGKFAWLTNEVSDDAMRAMTPCEGVVTHLRSELSGVGP